MGHTLYDGTIVVAQAILNSLSHILHKAELRPHATTLLGSRLYEDMYPLSDQVRLTILFSEGLATRLTGWDPMVLRTPPMTFSQCYSDIETVLRVLGEADKNVVNQYGDKVDATEMDPGMTVEMSNAMYAHTIALPNIFFHLTTAYAILRKEGVPLGKRDYYVGFLPQQLAGSQ
jgi:hypothetical protein